MRPFLCMAVVGCVACGHTGRSQHDNVSSGSYSRCPDAVWSEVRAALRETFPEATVAEQTETTLETDWMTTDFVAREPVTVAAAGRPRIDTLEPLVRRFVVTKEDGDRLRVAVEVGLVARPGEPPSPPRTLEQYPLTLVAMPRNRLQRAINERLARCHAATRPQGE